MEQNLILNPALVANGSISREQIKTRINQSASDCELSALDKLQYLKSLDKATGAILRDKDEEERTIADRALEQALAKSEVQDIIAQARAEERKENTDDKKKSAKKTFLHNGCKYQLKETITYDFASNPQKYNQPECVDWRNHLQCVRTLDEQIELLRAQQAVAREQMELDEKIYFNSHPDCERTITYSIVVP
jgi:hypothetical protein